MIGGLLLGCASGPRRKDTLFRPLLLAAEDDLGTIVVGATAVRDIAMLVSSYRHTRGKWPTAGKFAVLHVLEPPDGVFVVGCIWRHGDAQALLLSGDSQGRDISLSFCSMAAEFGEGYQEDNRLGTVVSLASEVLGRETDVPLGDPYLLIQPGWQDQSSVAVATFVWPGESKRFYVDVSLSQTSVAASAWAEQVQLGQPAR